VQNSKIAQESGREAELTSLRAHGTGDNMSRMRADVVIAGGGMVGLTLAIALAQGGLEVVVADPLTREQMADAISGNLCRCTGYTSIYEAIESAALKMGSSGVEGA